MPLTVDINSLHSRPTQSGFMRHAMALAVAGSLGCFAAVAGADQGDHRSTVSSVLAQAQTETVRTFNIPSQPLSAALTDFGRQAGLQVAVDSSLVAGVNSNAVTGNHLPATALTRLLAGSNLSGRVENGVAIILAQAPQNRPASRQGQVQTSPEQTEQRPTQGTSVESIVVVGRATNALVTAEDLDNFQASDLADVFLMIPAISVGGGASGIAQKIYVRGLEDSLINVRVDGAPQTSTLFHHIGRVTIDPDLLKEVEVQAGAGEATSGAGAIGGSIRFRTKDVNDLLGQNESFGGRVKASTFSNDGQQLSASLAGRISDTWGLVGYLNQVDRDNAEDGDGNELYGTAAEQTLGLLKVSGEINENQYLSLSYEKRQEEGQFTTRPNWSPLAGEPLYDGTGERDTVVGNYQWRQGDLLNLELSAYNTQSAFERVDARAGMDTYRTDITSYGLDLRNTSYIGAHRVTYGLDYRDDEVDSRYLYGYQYSTDSSREQGEVFGAYIQAHSQVTDRLLLSYGARYDGYDFKQLNPDPVYSATAASTDSDDISINAGLAYDITRDWTFSLGYAEAARGKEIGDGFTIYGTTIAPSLDAETVSNTEVSIEYSVENLNAKFAVFQSDIDDVIYDQSSGGVLFENIGTIETDGFEFDLAWRWQDLEVFLGYAAHDSTLDPDAGVYSVDYDEITLESYEFNGLGNSRGDTWNLGLDYNMTPSLTVGWNMTLVDDLNDMLVLHRAVDLGWIDGLQFIDKPGYNTHDIYAEWQPVSGLQVNLAVTNLLDETYLDHSSVADYGQVGWDNVKGYNEPGRDIRLALTYSF